MSGTMKSLLAMLFLMGMVVMSVPSTMAQESGWEEVFTSPYRYLNDLVVYDGKLYATTGNGHEDPNGFLYVSEDGKTWSEVTDFPEVVFAHDMYVYNNRLYIGTTTDVLDGNPDDRDSTIYYYDGTSFIQDFTDPYSGGYPGMGSFVEHNGHLYAMYGHEGRVYKRNGDSDWELVGDVSNCGGQSLVSFNGSLYMGTGYYIYCPAELWRDDGSGWVEFENYYDEMGAEDAVTNFAVYNNKLYVSTGYGRGYGTPNYLFEYTPTDTGMDRTTTELAGASMEVVGAELWASSDGELYKKKGDGDWDLAGETPGNHFVVFKGYVYAGKSHSPGGAAQIFRQSYTPTFTNIAPAMGVTAGYHNESAHWGDIDNDGDLDVVVAGGNGTRDYLYENINNGESFVDISDEWGIDIGISHWAGAVFGDYDNDGLLDLWIGRDLSKSALYHNEGDHFEDVTDSVGLGGLEGHLTQNNWMDYDRDGDLDLFIGGEEDTFVFRNDYPNEHFTLVDVGLDSKNNSQAWGDYDNDGDMDLYVSNTGLYRNDQVVQVDGSMQYTFTLLSDIFPISIYGGEWGDYDNDGDLDLVIPKWRDKIFVFRNDGGDNFTDVTDELGILSEPTSNLQAANWVDYDNDGDLDLYVASYGDYDGGFGTDHFYRNDGDHFTEISSEIGLADDAHSLGGSWGDFDADGDLDLYAVNWIEDARLWRNDGGNTGNWLNIALEGVVSNRNGIGSRVEVVAGDLAQVRELGSSSGRSENAMSLWLGLGGYSQVDSVTIWWPSGIVQVLNNVPSNQTLTVIEDEYTSCFARVNNGLIHHTVQDAVDRAQAGDEIKIAGYCAGVENRMGITQTAYISKSITLRGGYTITNWMVSDPVANPTTLDAQGQGRVLYVTGNVSLTIEGLHIINGDASGLGTGPGASSAWIGYGGGMYVDSAGVALRDSHLLSNTAELGGGLYLDHIMSNSVILSNTIEANTGGGIHVYSSEPLIEGNRIIDNRGQGISLSYYASPNIIHNTITGNDGDGIHISNGWVMRPRIHFNTIANNTGYGIYNESPNDIDATENNWGTTDPTEISQAIWDFDDNLDIGVWGDTVGLVEFSSSFVNGAEHISGNTVWSGVHIITSHIWIDPDATLTIMAGTRVNFTGRYGIFNHGRLHIQGTSLEPVIFTPTQSITSSTWGTVKFDYQSEGTVEYAEIFRAFRGLVVYASSPNVDHTLISNSSEEGILAYYRSKPYLNDVTVTRGHSTGILLNLSDPIIKNSTVSDNQGVGIWAQYYASPRISHSYIISNGGDGLYFDAWYGGNDRHIDHSCIYGNGGYSIHNMDKSDIDATYNYWGTTEAAEIDQLIYDNNDDSSCGKVNFEPFLDECSSPPLLALYALAFDVPLASPYTLSPQYPDTIAGIQRATLGISSTAIVLADLEQNNDTHILVIQDGKIIERIMHLPDTDGVLSSTLHEYDMTSGSDLGGFLKWVMSSSYNTASTRVTFSYIGHGSAVVPNTDLSELFNRNSDHMQIDTSSVFGVIPMPSRVGVHTGYTDYHPRKSIISPGALAEALRIATHDGHTPIAVLDLVHCFAASIEEFYALAPYAETLLGSPNYTYFDSDMPSQALRAMETVTTSQDMATAIIDSYHNSLPPEEHPHLLIAVDGDKVAGIEDSWNRVSYYLLNGFDATTRAKLLSVYQASHKYDTTFCEPQDWALGCPDALVDLADFAEYLNQEFGPLSDVGINANTTVIRVEDAIIARRSSNGSPWFANVSPDPVWNFDDYVGLSLYADLGGKTIDDITYLSWQAHWYTGTNYAFTRDAQWDEVFNHYWQGEQKIETDFCLPVFPPEQRPGEVGIERVIFPLVGSVTQNTPVQFSVAVTTSHVALNPLVQFTVTLNGDVVFSNTVGTGYLVTGTHQVDASQTWTPDETGTFELIVTINDDRRITKDDPKDNSITITGRVWPSGEPRPVISAGVSSNLQWVNSNDVRLDVIQDTRTMPPVRRLGVQVYQYPSDVDPVASQPVLIDTQVIDSLTLPLSDWAIPLPLSPGPVVLHIWAWSASGLSVAPAIVEFNYAPLDTPIIAGDTHYYLFTAEQGDSLQIDLTVAEGQDANLFVWDPSTFGFPTWQSTIAGSDALAFEATFTGQYVLSVYGETDATYTLNVVRNGAAGHRGSMATGGDRGVNNTDAYVPNNRPTFIPPVPQDLGSQLSGHKIFLPLVIRR